MARMAAARVLLAVFVGISGCSNPGEARDTSDLNSLAVYYLDYLRANRRPPPDEAALRAHIEAAPPENRERNHATDIDSVFVSPRDGKPYIVLYGEATGGRAPDVYAYEAEGANGQRWVAYSLGYVREVDAEEFGKIQQDLPATAQ